VDPEIICLPEIIKDKKEKQEKKLEMRGKA